MNPALVRPIPVIEPPSSGQLDQAFWDHIFNQDIVILRGFLDKIWPLEHEMFTIDQIDKEYGEFEMTVLRQKRKKQGFAVHRNSKREEQIQKYVEYIR